MKPTRRCTCDFFLTLCGALLFSASLACGDKVAAPGTSAVDHGRAIFQSSAASPGKSNVFACATCHAMDDTNGNAGTANAASAPGASRIFSGGSLVGATSRGTFWGGQENDLLRSVNDCRAYFMDAPRPWTTQDEDARALYAFLATRGDDSVGAARVKFTALSEVVNAPGGDATHGAQIYEAACSVCHGAPHSGEKKIAKFVPTLPEYMLKTHATDTPEARRIAVIDKIRRGAFMSAADSMPPFSLEILADRDVADVVTYLGF